jgi:two-component system OmpR family response regulator
LGLLAAKFLALKRADPLRILLIEDDGELAEQIRKALQKSGYAVDVAYDGEEGHFLGSTESFDAAILDLGLPKIDGLTVLGRWRREKRDFPVLILTARDSWSEKVRGIDAGADDYLAKPFRMEELEARIRALLRRAAGHASPELVCGPISLDTRCNRVSVNDLPITLTAAELRLLRYLMHHAGRVISRTELVEHLYEQDFDRDSNTIEVFVNRLRKKLGVNLIRTLRGQGYRLAISDDAP